MSAFGFEMPRPPADITPVKFFEEWLPPIIGNFQALIKDNAADLAATLLAIRVTGDQGGEWSVRLEGGAVSIDKGLKPDAMVTLVLNKDNFVEAVTGQREDLMMQPPKRGGGGMPDPAKIREQITSTMETLRNVFGTIQFRAEDPQKPFAVTIKFAGELKEPPDTVISVDVEDLRLMAKGEISPPSAFMSGKIKINGDMGLLMQLAPLMMQQ